MTSSLHDRPLGPRRVPTGPAQRWRALAFLLGGYLMVFAAVTLMNVALPSAQADLGMSDAGRQWLLTIYSLAFGGLMLLGGRVADVIGLRRSVAVGLWGFAAASLAGGLAGDGATLLAARALQGAAGALVAPAGLALLSVMFEHGPERTRAFGILGTVMGLGTAGSFVVAGWLTDALSWRWCMLVNVPIAAVAAVGLARTAPPGAATGRRRIDVLGALAVTAAVGALVLGFDRATRDGWQAPWTVGLIAAGVALLGLFLAAAGRTSDPLLPLGLLADRARGAAYLAVFVLAVGMFAGFFLLTTYLQDVLGYSALRTGVAFLPFGATAMAASRALAAAAAGIPPVRILTIGLLATGTGIALLVRLSASSGYVTGVLPTMLLLGIGGTAVMVTASNLATIGAGADSGAAGAAVGATQQIGAALGTALLSSVAVAATDERYGAAAPAADDPARLDTAWLDAVVHGFTRAGALGAVVLVAGALVVRRLAGRSAGVTATAEP